MEGLVILQGLNIAELHFYCQKCNPAKYCLQEHRAVVFGCGDYYLSTAVTIDHTM